MRLCLKIKKKQTKTNLNKNRTQSKTLKIFAQVWNVQTFRRTNGIPEFLIVTSPWVRWWCWERNPIILVPKLASKSFFPRVLWNKFLFSWSGTEAHYGSYQIYSLLLQAPECQDDRHVLPCPTFVWFQKLYTFTGEIDLQLRASAALLGDLHSIPNTHKIAHNCNSSSRWIHALSWPPQALSYPSDVQLYSRQNTYTGRKGKEK